MRYPDGTVDQAARIASLVSEGWTLAVIPLVLFARHQLVTEEALKTAYRTLLTSFGHAAAAVDADNPKDRADKIAQHMFRRAKRNDIGKSWIRRSGVYGARWDSPLLDALAGLTSLLLADVTPSAQAEEAMTKIFGVPEEEQEQFLQMLGCMSVESLLEVLDRTTLHGLEMARTVLQRSTSTFMRMQRLLACQKCGVDLYGSARKLCPTCWPVVRADYLRQLGKARTKPPAPAKPTAEQLSGGWTFEQYQTRILPALRPIALPDMERATGLSNATCSRVRRGLQVPNPQHWAALATLAGLGS
jgi:hypothetical protein